jgi:hypothetical protein
MFRIAVLAGLAFMSLTCSDSSGPVFEDCPERVEVQASPGVTPTFSWSPACGMAFLHVSMGEDLLWIVRAATDTTIPNPFASGMQYGKTPRHGHVWVGPEPLEAGKVYEVRVGRRRCELSGPCNPWEIGALQFIP